MMRGVSADRASLVRTVGRMRLSPDSGRVRMAACALALVAMVALPPLREALEASMMKHMLVQFPALMLAGTLLALAVPKSWRQRADACNALGMSGLVFVALTLAVLMIPRVLDLALTDARVEAAKVASLMASGLALSLSWRRAGLVVQSFFLGNVLPMTAVAGSLYSETPLRLCNAYAIDEQQTVGVALVGCAVVVATVWLARVGWRLVRQGADSTVLSDAQDAGLRLAVRSESQPGDASCRT